MGFDMTIPAGGSADWAQKWAELKSAHDAIWQALMKLADSRVFNIVSTAGQALGSFTAGEFKFRYPRITWKLVASVPANGGVGATVSYPKGMTEYSKWTSADTFILPTGLLGYGAWGAKGYNYLSLHETAHTTMAGLRSTDACWDDHRRHHHDTYQTGCPAWERNERLANDIALTVAKALNLEIIGTPNPGIDIQALAARAPQTPEEIPLALLDIGPRTRPAARKKPRRSAKTKRATTGRKSTAKKKPKPATRRRR